ncbi:MAG: tRNA pseudouridine(55) synthase TruB [Myxococcaceae bacterium]
MNGVLVIDKPAGPTSFDVVKRVRSLLKVKKAGHTGTLDPAATGVLPICLEDATKVAGYITLGDKAYDAVIRLGQTTDTQDAMGKVLSDRPVPNLTKALLEEAFAKFRGTFQQTPPMYSAVKVDGKRLYELARKGEEVERAARTVTVHELTLRDFSSNELRLSVRCSKGFFVRTLAFELGEALGCGAHLKALRRTMSGPFSLSQAVALDKLETLTTEEVSKRLVPVGEALSELPSVSVNEADGKKVVHGMPLEGFGEQLGRGKLRVLGHDGALLAIGEVDAASGRLKYLRVLVER